MQSRQVRFKRKTNFITSTKKKYDEFINHSFELITLDLADEQIVKILKNEYSNIADANIEKNELFIQRITELKKEILTQKDEIVTQKFILVISLYFQAELLSLADYEYLVDFKHREIAKDFSSVDLFQIKKQETNPPLLDHNQREEKILSPTGSPKFKLWTLDDFNIHDDKNIVKFIFNSIISKLGTEEKIEERKKALTIIVNLFNKIDFRDFGFQKQVKKVFYGSAITNFSTVTSDIDISIETEEECDSKELLSFFRDQIKKYLNNYRHKIQPFLFDNISIPLIDITLHDYSTTMSFSVNNELAVINSRMLELYSRLDSRCQLLGLLVKIWSEMNEINSAKKQYLSSYAYILMVINFLQIQKPPILPSLQKLRENDSEAKYLDVKIKHKNQIETFRTRVDYEDDIEKLNTIMTQSFSENKKNTIQLLKKFFKFYSKKDYFSQRILSIKQGTHLNNTSDFDGLFLYSIEDPFDITRNPGRHVKATSGQANKIVETMEKSYQLLKMGYFEEIFQISKGYQI